MALNRNYFLVLMGVLLSHFVFGQKPVIVSVTPNSSAMGMEAIIIGTGFNTDLNQLIVHFGSANATILEARENLISVIVPPGTTYRTISVTNLVSGLTGYSPSPYLLSYSGTTFDASLFDAPQDFLSESELYDISLDDFDGDGKIDIVTANNNSNLINIFKNTSTTGSISLVNQFITISSNTINVNTRDLNGDGKPEIVVSKSGNPGDRVYYLKNTSTVGTISFAPPEFLLVDGNIARRIEIEDLDKDGLPEIIVSNQSNDKISILKNTSSGGNISFDPLQAITLVDPNGTSLHSAGLAVCDLNGDGFPEIITTRFLEKDVYITPNQSQIGSLNFGDTQILSISGNLSFVASGDINHDGKNDLIISKLQQGQISVLINNGVASDISFDPEVLFLVNARPWGIALGDLNGDGLTDIAVASINETDTKISVLENQSSSGSLALSVSYITTPQITRNLKIGDIDNDGKPDLTFTSLGTTVFNVTVLRNKNCFIPKMEPSTTQDLCLNAEVTLNATPNNDAIYTWKRSDNTTLGSGTDPFFTFTAAVGSFDYHVEVTTESGACVTTSNITTINVSTGVIPNPPLILDPVPVCEGGDITLSIDPATLISGATYTWIHPDGTTTTGDSYPLTNVSISDAGRYLLSAFDGGCESSLDSAFFEVIATPQITIISNDNLVFCAGQSIDLMVPNDPSYSYKWFKDGTEISGAITSSIVVTTSGNYTTEVNTSSGCFVASNPATTISATHPVASFDLPNLGCIDNNISFANTSSIQNGINVYYLWDFGDGSQSTDENPTHIYTTSGDYTVSLTVSYDDVTCANQTSSVITISAPQTISINADVTEFCQGDTSTLSITGTYTTILWSTSESTNTITVGTGGTYSIAVTTDAGCQSTASIGLVELSLPNIQVAPSDPVIEQGGSIQLVASGAVSYAWAPSLGLDDPTIANPIGSPDITTLYQVTGTDINQCKGITEVTVTVNEATAKLVPKLLFSPNNDGINDFWVIENIDQCVDCTLSIFDRTGKTIFEEVNYSQSWNGTYNGSDLETGVYYFVITDGSNKLSSGSITLVR